MAMATPASSARDEIDRRFMAAAIRLSRRHLGLTGTNPSVGTLIVREESGGPIIVGSGVTAVGGRPHAEPQALYEAGERARGATAYVTLEPCAHHGRTPPCAEALVTAGVARVVGATSDPDPRVSGKGYAILRKAGIEVVEGVLAEGAADLMAGYLMRSSRKRPEVTVKLAVSRDGRIGIPGVGQVVITGEISRRQVHLMRAEADAILIGIGTALADDPELTCRLPGLEAHSPVRIVLDAHTRLPLDAKMVRHAREVPVWIAAAAGCDRNRRAALEGAGVQFLATEAANGGFALPELLEDLAARGISTLIAEGGAETVRRFLDEDLVDRVALFVGPGEIGPQGLLSPIRPDRMREGFRLTREARYGEDSYSEWVRKA
ncbi:bifunctional diaminohydroxyphosphoribosylaminopyrimidine deaminase/5-amino-6-(5-phosphoribosylamino)uracil reductase RibD [Mesorhizobium koreense]|uniref:bifunctional diaminohydroxyphosphoribosylaminopyrimidine deaminase/5-amino-6-(5-phosphoribosylamino)uracil reductase RibD n=1 Tax=Mesorhizobium koreense TaxID=3074855 RepID=UPI003530267B